MEYRISSAINKMSVIDHHAHNLLPSSIMLNNAAALEKIWSEAQDESVLTSVRSNLTSYRAIKELALILGCEPNRKAIQDARMALSPDSLCNLLLKVFYPKQKRKKKSKKIDVNLLTHVFLFFNCSCQLPFTIKNNNNNKKKRQQIFMGYCWMMEFDLPLK